MSLQAPDGISMLTILAVSRSRTVSTVHMHARVTSGNLAGPSRRSERTLLSETDSRLGGKYLLKKTVASEPSYSTLLTASANET
jgi:hypothetical protein